MTTQLPIYTQIHSRYQVFDASGRLPFSIVFGFCRRVSTDTDTRPLVFDVSSSVLDVPYALATGLLTLHERDPHDIHHYIDVDLSRISKTPAREAVYLSLPSPVNRTRSWRESFTTYLYAVDAGSELASILEPGKKYSFRLASKDLGVRCWAYSDRQDPLTGDKGKLLQFPESAELVNSKSTGGNATFKVVQSLHWPPQVETRMCLASSSDQATVSTQLEISVTSTGERPVTVQTRGNQSFLIPWGPMQPLSDTLSDSLRRIIDADPHKPPTSSLKVFDSATGQAARDNSRRGVCSLGDPRAPRRPKVEWLVTLNAGETIVGRVGIGNLLHGLEDGSYQVKMEGRGCWWSDVEIDPDDDGRVSEMMYKKMIPPLMLESQDIVKLLIRGGKVISEEVA